MVIDVRIVPEGHSRIEQETRLEAWAGELPQPRTPVRCVAEIDRMGETIAANVRFTGEFEVPCARCLENYAERVEGSLTVILKEARGKHGLSLDDDDGVDFYFDVNHELVDIGQALYEEIMIALPVKPLCSEKCEGIPFADDNVDNDGEEHIDPRWEALKKLRIKN